MTTVTSNTLPCDKEAEQFVIGAMLNSIEAINECIPQLSIFDFYFVEHQEILKAIQVLYNKGFSVNCQNVITEIKSEKNTSWEYILTLGMQGTGIDHVYFLTNLLNVSKLRRVLMASQEAMINSKNRSADSQEIISKLQNDLFLIQGLGFENTKNPKDILTNYENGRNFQDHSLYMFDQIRAGKLAYSGIPSGYPLLDKTLGFFRPGCYYTIGARTSMGKTTFLLNLIRNMNLNRKTSVGFFSMEMPAKTIVAKLVCLFAGVKFRDYEDATCSTTDLEMILSWGKEMEKMPIYIEDQSGLTISQFRARAKRMLQNYKIEILFVDYLTLIKSDNKQSNNHLVVNDVSKGIQCLAKELNIPIVVLAQLNRQVAGRTNNKPTLADFRESGSIEEDSDACLMLHRPEYYDPYAKPGVAELYIAKNRLRGLIKKIDYNVPVGEVYQELEAIEDCNLHMTEETKKRFAPYKDD